MTLRNLSNLVWGLARLDYVDPELYQLAGARAKLWLQVGAWGCCALHAHPGESARACHWPK